MVISIYGGKEYVINKLNSSSLEMTWDDENFRIFFVGLLKLGKSKFNTTFAQKINFINNEKNKRF